MSRFIDKLTQLRQGESRPIGFAVAAVSSEKKRMQMVVSLKASDLDELSGSLEPADAVLVEINKTTDNSELEKACKLKDNPPGGGWFKAVDKKTQKNISSTSCDFVVFPADLPLAAAQKEKLGRILEVDASWSDGMLRAAGELPVDAVLLSSQNGEESLNYNRLMLVQRAASLINKPILVLITGSYGAAELQALWDTGVSGVVIEVTDTKSAEVLAGLRKAIDGLKIPDKVKKTKTSPLIPRLRPEAPQNQDEEEEEDD